MEGIDSTFLISLLGGLNENILKNLKESPYIGST